jgi:hypothetical protein
MRDPTTNVRYQKARKFARAYLVSKVRSGVFEQKTSDPVAMKDVLATLIDTMHDEDDPSMRELLGWEIEDRIEEMMRHHSPGRPKREENQKRIIRRAVNLVVRKFGLHPHRGPATRDKGHIESGCSIVAWALRDLGILDMTEAKVTEIVLNRTR